ncbi:MAG: hypothetical protein A2033_14295 [Bacteroidetes bacterium GWA2_31_9]|nr:MAG: hypothetical protein A2033_14295 [Bacteroidetes bacterium GWA2_31_9]
MDTNLQTFIEEIRKAYSNNTFKKLIVSKSVKKDSDIKRIFVKLVTIKKEEKFSFVFEYTTKNITKNFSIEEVENQLLNTLEIDFKNAVLYTQHNDIQLSYNKKMKAQLNYGKPTCTETISKEHNKLKHRIINIENNIYLRELGITNQANTVIQGMQSKYKQINKYIETIDAVIKDSELSKEKSINIVDMGSGKGYLTFATYDFLNNILKFNASVTGVEIRKELVNLCNNIAEKCNFKNLHFHTGDIKSFQIPKIDVLIALHACDTATDDAIYKGISLGASIIVVAPCCHKQIRKELNIHNELNLITKYGILEERMAETVTDTLRGLVLEFFGYKTQIFEFISDEHTHKNVIIVGVKKSIPKKEDKIIEKISNLKQMFGIKEFYLENALKNKIYN